MADTHNNRIQVLNVTDTDYIEVIRVIANNMSVLYEPRGISVDLGIYLLPAGGLMMDHGYISSSHIT